MVSERQWLHIDSIYRCRLGQLCGWQEKHKWRCILFGRNSGGMVKQEANICLSIYSRSVIHSNNILLHTSNVDETNSPRHEGKHQWTHFYQMWQYKCNKYIKNLVLHSKTKHIQIKYHFLKDPQRTSSRENSKDGVCTKKGK